MPTAAKLIGSIAFMIVGWFAAQGVLTTIPENQPTGLFAPTIAAIGFFTGWFVSGGNAGKGYRMSVGNGIRASVQVAVFGLILFALYEMFGNSLRLRYDGPGEAVTAALEFFLEYFFQSLIAPVWTVLIGGGIMAGIVVEWSSRRWR